MTELAYLKLIECGTNCVVRAFFSDRLFDLTFLDWTTCLN